MTTINNQDTPINILQSARKLLGFHDAIGIENYPASEGLEIFLHHRQEVKKGEGRFSAPEPSLPGDSALEDIIEDLGDCTRCGLHKDRTHLVFGQGSARSGLFIVGEWPGPEDDLQNNPFSGEAGDLLDKMLTAIGLDRDDVYLTQTIKCRPKSIKEPLPEHVQTCKPFLLRQIAVANPKVICAMGPLAAQTLLNTDQLLFKLRGRFHKFMNTLLMPTFHPAFLLNNPEMKKAVWIDLQMIQKKLHA